MECAVGSEGGRLATDVDALRLLVQGPEVDTPCATCRPEVVLRGRSAMSGWINSTSMGGAFSSGFSGKCQLLDKDIRTGWTSPQFTHCNASKATVACTIPKP